MKSCKSLNDEKSGLKTKLFETNVSLEQGKKEQRDLTAKANGLQDKLSALQEQYQKAKLMCV